MFTTLIESRRTKDRTLGGTALSVLVHAAVITLGVFVTAHAGERREPTPVVRIDYFPLPPDKAPRPYHASRGNASSHGSMHTSRTPVIAARVNIDVDLPPIGTMTELTSSHDFDGVRTTDGESLLAGGDGADGAHAYFASQVDTPALPGAGNAPPRYPLVLERSRVNGEVIAQFVVDSAGRVDMRTFRIVRTSNDLFSASLQSVLPSWRFLPARAGGRRVSQVVQLPVQFAVPSHE